MKKLAVFAGILFFGSLEILAQGKATATMNVSVRVISGVTLTNSPQISINLENNEMTGGIFTLTTPGNLDTQIDIEQDLILTNEFGDVITYESGSRLQSADKKKILEVLATPAGDQEKKLTGKYTGELIASVQYL